MNLSNYSAGGAGGRRRRLGDGVPLPGRGVSPFGVNVTIFEWDCKGQSPFAGVRGVPEILLFSLFARRRRRRAEDEDVGAQPQAPG